MKPIVKVKGMRGVQEMLLADFLEPHGSVEQALDLARKSARVVGKLVAHFVETDKLTFEQAKKIVGDCGYPPSELIR